MTPAPTASAEARRALVARLGARALPAAPTRRACRTARAPLSYPQQQLWFLDQLKPGGTEYIAPWLWRVDGPLDVAALRAAWSEVVARHEVLRTRYRKVDGEIAQVVDPPSAVEIPVVDVSHLPPTDQEAAVEAVTERELDTPFDIGADPPLRLVLVRLGPDRHALVMAVHHIAFDGWSVGVLAAEVSTLYPGLVTGRAAELAPPPLQYADFAVWQRGFVDGDEVAARVRHWRDRLAGVTPVELPTDRPRPRVLDTSGASTSFTVPPGVAAALRDLGRTRRATPFMVLLACYQVLLARYSGQADITVGTPVAGRARPVLQRLIGFFVNTLVLRCDLAGDPSFADVLDRVRGAALDAFAHQDVPFEKLVTELAPGRDPSRNPLFSHMFVFQDTASADFGGAGVTARSVPLPSRSAKFDLGLQLTERPDGGLDGVLEYATALYDRATAERLARHFTRLLTAVAADPDARIGDLGLLADDERRALLTRANETARPIPERTTPELIAEQVRRGPDALAVRCAGAELTYAELDAESARLAHHLRELGAAPGTLVGVHLDRGVGLLVALLAVLRAGAAYVPIDPGYPDKRVAYMLADSGASLLITGDPAAGAETPGLQRVLPDRDRELIAAQPATPPPTACGPDDLAYLIYTSGSTGTPKGVLVHHRGLANFLLAMLDRPWVAPGSAMVGITTASFDPSVVEFYLPLLVGAPLLLADTEEARDPHRMAALIDAAGRATVQATPTTYRMLLDTGWRPRPELTLLTGGEKLPADLARALTERGSSVWDIYGPTETTVWTSTALLADDGTTAAWDIAANTTLHVLDDRFEPVPDGVLGQIHIGGANLAWGYHGKPEATAAAFVPDPHAATPGARLYRTGDLGRRRADGAVQILGRADHQVKIRGHRMEPGEIETALLADPALTAAAVHPQVLDGDLHLVAYLVAAPGHEAPPAERLRADLRATLPDYMVPTAFVVLDALPKTPSGKVDRTALPRPDRLRAGERVSPRTPRERFVAAVWQEVLGRDGIGAHDDFFAVGGHSLLATRVTVRLRAGLGIDVPVRALFDHTTVAALAAALDDYPTTDQRPAAAPIPRRRAPRRTGGVR